MDQIIHRHGTGVYLVEAHWVAEEGADADVVTLGCRAKTIGVSGGHGLRSRIAQFYKIVVPGMIFTGHIFQGLKRPQKKGDDMDADAKNCVYTWKPKRDFWWGGGKTSGDGYIVEVPPPAGRVFTVIVAPNLEMEQWPEIRGWIVDWAWVRESKELAYAPVEYQDRYAKRLWSQNKEMTGAAPP